MSRPRLRNVRRMLLTSAGIRNEILRSALADLIGKSFADASVVFIPTASVAGAGDHGWFVEDLSRLCGLGSRALDILELNGLPRLMVPLSPARNQPGTRAACQQRLKIDPGYFSGVADTAGMVAPSRTARASSGRELAATQAVFLAARRTDRDTAAANRPRRRSAAYCSAAVFGRSICHS